MSRGLNVSSSLQLETDNFSISATDISERNQTRASVGASGAEYETQTTTRATAEAATASAVGSKSQAALVLL